VPKEKNLAQELILLHFNGLQEKLRIGKISLALYQRKDFHLPGYFFPV